MGSEPSVVSVMTIRQAMTHGLVKNGGSLNMSNSISTLNYGVWESLRVMTEWLGM